MSWFLTITQKAGTFPHSKTGAYSLYRSLVAHFWGPTVKSLRSSDAKKQVKGGNWVDLRIGGYMWYVSTQVKASGREGGKRPLLGREQGDIWEMCLLSTKQILKIDLSILPVLEKAQPNVPSKCTGCPFCSSACLGLPFKGTVPLAFQNSGGNTGIGSRGHSGFAWCSHAVLLWVSFHNPNVSQVPKSLPFSPVCEENQVSTRHFYEIPRNSQSHTCWGLWTRIP